MTIKSIKQLTAAQQGLIKDLWDDTDLSYPDSMLEILSTDNRRTLKALVDKGLVELDEHEECVRLTDTGLELAGEIDL